MLAIAEMDITVILYMTDGTPYPLPAVHLGKSAVASVNVNSALAAAPASDQTKIFLMHLSSCCDWSQLRHLESKTAHWKFGVR